MEKNTRKDVTHGEKDKKKKKKKKEKERRKKILYILVIGIRISGAFY